MARAFWGLGYAPEAAAASVGFGFRTLDLPQIVANAALTNMKSRRVIEKLGMSHDRLDDFDYPLVASMGKHSGVHLRYNNNNAVPLTTLIPGAVMQGLRRGMTSASLACNPCGQAIRQTKAQGGNRMRLVTMAAKAAVALTILGCGTFALPACATPFSQLLVFGDSNVDDGNLFAATGVPASPPYYQGRFSNGLVVVDYVSQRLGIPLVDYAYGGATTGTNVPLGNFSIPSVLTQINNYSATLNGTLIDPNALVVVWVGSNDLLGAMRNTPPAQANLSTRISNAVVNIDNAVAQLVQEGAQTILVANRTPRPVLTSDDNLNGIDLNAAINPAVQALDTTYAANIELFDVYDLIADLQTNPGKYGFTNTTQPCLVGTVVCATPDTYTQWDGAHKTTHVASIVANELIAQAQEVPEPGTLVLLGTGLVALALGRRNSAAAVSGPTDVETRTAQSASAQTYGA